MKLKTSKHTSNNSRKNGRNNNGTRAQVGILEWFHFEDYEHVEAAIEQLQKLGISHLRTGFSWADYHRPGGQNWFDWLIPKLGKHFNILPCFLYTPPSIGLAPKTSSPPEDPHRFGWFVGQMIERYNEFFEYVELWNEPNNMSEYDFTLDQNWSRFTTMIKEAAKTAHKLGKKVLLGGMSPIDPNWLDLMRQEGVLKAVDAVGIHGFPNVFDSHWNGWDTVIDMVNQVLEKEENPPRLWITEAGYSTWQHNERQQLLEFLKLIEAPVDRVYWYSLSDLGEHRPTVDGYHLDEREYYFGIYKKEGEPKLLARLLEEDGVDRIHRNEWIAQPYVSQHSRAMDDQSHVVITGGAGFIGTNLADRLLSIGHRVTILDNLSREGVLRNIRYLKKNHHKNLNIQVCDIRNPYVITEVVQSADMIFHFAAQVAVTTSLDDPKKDFDVNLMGTLNILNALRAMDKPAPILFTSTNKVYGDLENLQLKQDGLHYTPTNEEIAGKGLSESLNLDFHSPYGCSKGAADQYIIDHARTMGLQAVVFRMSCIYGPHQCGNEDQGWVAHFTINALNDEPITLFGDGKQVRDILYVEDLVDAFIAAWENMDRISGEAFNIGGGAGNSVSLLEVIQSLERELNTKVKMGFEDWRKGDQRYYVTDYSKFEKATGWKPKVNYQKGLALLGKWLEKNTGTKRSSEQELKKTADLEYANSNLS